jgi:hypothetical protein
LTNRERYAADYYHKPNQTFSQRAIDTVRTTYHDLFVRVQGLAEKSYQSNTPDVSLAEAFGMGKEIDALKTSNQKKMLQIMINEGRKEKRLLSTYALANVLLIVSAFICAFVFVRLFRLHVRWLMC